MRIMNTMVLLQNTSECFIVPGVLQAGCDKCESRSWTAGVKSSERFRYKVLV